MAKITIPSETTDKVAAIIGETLNGWFQPHLNFAPVVVRQKHDDWYGEDYLEAWIIWEGDYGRMDHRRINGLSWEIRPQLDALGLDLELHSRYIAKWEWEQNKERILR